MSWYTVYGAQTDELLACGSAAKCARTLGLALASFYSALSRTRKGLNQKYHIMTEHLKRSDLP